MPHYLNSALAMEEKPQGDIQFGLYDIYIYIRANILVGR